MLRPRTTRSKAIVGVGGAAATLVATAAIAVGQVLPNLPDGSPAGAVPGAEHRCFFLWPRKTTYCSPVLH